MPPDSTLPGQPIATMVLVMPDPRLLDTCLQLASELPTVPRVEVTDVKSTANVVAKWRPFALIVPEEICNFDPEEFRALARDVGAALITARSDASYEAMTATLSARVTTALTDWERRQDEST